MPSLDANSSVSRSMPLLAGTAIVFFGALSVTVCVTAPALAQTASQITPQSFEPQLQKPGAGFSIPEGVGPVAPAGAEKLSVRVSGVSIEGGLPALSEAAEKVKAELSNRTVTAADLFAAAGRLEQAYAAKGYSLVRVILPAQRLTNGAVLKLVVIDGFLEQIDTSKLPENIRDRVAALLAPLAGRKGVTSAEIERRVLLAGDLPGTALRTTLSRGKQSGGSVLTVEALYRPVTGSASIDNSLTDELGHYNLGVGVDFNSVLGLGELIYVRASGAPRVGTDGDFFGDMPRTRSLALGATLPIGIDGLTLNFEVTGSRTVPDSASGLDFMSEFTRYSTRLAYPLIRSRDFTLNLKSAFDIQNETLDLLNGGGTAISEDRLRILRMGTDFSWYAPGDALLTGGLETSFGFDAFGARTRGDADRSGIPLSRDGADADFQKLEIDLGYRQPVAEHLTFDFKAKGQTSFGQPLLNSEQIGIASTSGLSSFYSGTMQGDDGFVLRAEAQFPFVLPFTLPISTPASITGAASADGTNAAAVISPYLFGAYGGVLLHQPSALEAAWSRGASYGVGLRLGASEQASLGGLNLNFEYGRIERFDAGSDDNSFTFSAALQF